MNSLQGRYLDKNDLMTKIKYIDINADDLISSDSYNEELMLTKFNSFDSNTQILLLKCAIHISIIGYGNKNYGAIRNDNGDVQLITDIFNKHGIQYNKNINEKYDKDTLSARRLIRLLRFHIQQFIINANRPSYLWLKYSDLNKDKASICFPGGEHLVENKEDAKYLYVTYNKLDKLMNTKFCERLRRVYIARRLFTPSDFLDDSFKI